LQQIHLSTAIHLAFDKLESRDLPLCLTVRPRWGDCGADRRLILSDAIREGRDEGLACTNEPPDRATGIGAWSDADIKQTLRTGIRPNGVPLAGVMPSGFYAVVVKLAVSLVSLKRPIWNTFVSALIPKPVDMPSVSDAVNRYWNSETPKKAAAAQRFCETRGESFHPWVKRAEPLKQVKLDGRLTRRVEAIRQLPIGHIGATTQRPSPHWSRATDLLRLRRELESSIRLKHRATREALANQRIDLWSTSQIRFNARNKHVSIQHFAIDDGSALCQTTLSTCIWFRTQTPF
jgi:hypothetical protein